MDIKTLTKLAKTCRKLGVSHLKMGDLDITLSSDILPAQKNTRAKLNPVNESLFTEQDGFTQQGNAQKDLNHTDLLFWSTNDASADQ